MYSEVHRRMEDNLRILPPTIIEHSSEEDSPPPVPAQNFEETQHPVPIPVVISLPDDTNTEPPLQTSETRYASIHSPLRRPSPASSLLSIPGERTMTRQMSTTSGVSNVHDSVLILPHLPKTPAGKKPGKVPIMRQDSQGVISRHMVPFENFAEGIDKIFERDCSQEEIGFAFSDCRDFHPLDKTRPHLTRDKLFSGEAHSESTLDLKEHSKCYYREVTVVVFLIFCLCAASLGVITFLSVKYSHIRGGEKVEIPDADIATELYPTTELPNTTPEIINDTTTEFPYGDVSDFWLFDLTTLEDDYNDTGPEVDLPQVDRLRSQPLFVGNPICSNLNPKIFLDSIFFHCEDSVLDFINASSGKVCQAFDQLQSCILSGLELKNIECSRSQLQEMIEKNHGYIPDIHDRIKKNNCN